MNELRLNPDKKTIDIMTPKQFLDKKHPNSIDSIWHVVDYFQVKKMLQQYRNILEKEFKEKYKITDEVIRLNPDKK